MNKLNFIKTLICTLVIFSLASCGVEEITGTGGGGTPTPTVSTTALQQIISNGNLLGLATGTDPLVNNTLAHLTDSANYTANTMVTAIYATETGSGDYSGTNWTNAIAAANLRNRITNITDASASKVYAVLVAGGTYKPTTGTDRAISFSMKNHVAVIGGFDATGSWELTGTTTFSGDIGTVGNTNDNTYRVFSHDSIALNNAVLYGVTVTGGNAKDFFPRNRGGGMYNNSSSPRLFNVVFAGNSANSGGGMYNTNSSPVLTGVVFAGNSSTLYGGGMYNRNSSAPRLFNVVFSNNSAGRIGGGMDNDSSSPVLTGVEFTGNSATVNGGGMYNQFSSPVLTGVEFNANSATVNGGGMFNSHSSPVLIGVVFNANRATAFGGGMYNDNGNNPGPLIVNTIFAGNTASGSGQDIAMELYLAESESIRIAGSVLGIGANNPTDGIVGVDSTNGAINLTYRSLANGAVNFGPNATLGGLTYPTIQSTSSAVDIGLYVRRSGTDYYFSEDNATWHTNFTTRGVLTGPAGTPPAGAEDLTARDIAGNARVGRPDAGVYEYKP